MAKTTLATSASGQLVTGVGRISKIIVNTHSSGIIKLVDSPNSSSGRVILSDYTLPAGSQVIDLDLEYYEGVHLVIVSGTATVQISTIPN